MDLTTYLAREKKQCNLRLTDLARRAAVGVSHLHDIKTGRRRPSLAVALRIEAATGGAVKPQDLIQMPPAEHAA